MMVSAAFSSPLVGEDSKPVRAEGEYWAHLVRCDLVGAKPLTKPAKPIGCVSWGGLSSPARGEDEEAFHAR